MNLGLDALLSEKPYGLNKEQKEKMLSERLRILTEYHREHCILYGNLLESLGADICGTYYDLPMLPVRMFKEYELLSVPRGDIKKVMTSSGTSGQKVSKIFLDTENARNQTKALTGLIRSFIGKERLPLIILDTRLIKKDRAMYSARGAGVSGFSTYGRDIFFALDEEMQLDLDGLQDYLRKHKDQKILLFGYTYMIWQYVIREMEKRNVSVEIKNGVLFHSGGWKKLQDQSVDNETYNQRARRRLGNLTIHNYYGMAEQLGSIYIECEYGHMHCSNYSDVVIRNPKDFSVCRTGEKGLMEVVSILPTSYPGHILLTEDEGEILGEDDCPCGRYGKYFKIYGRIKNAEVRGCSDTYERP